jgi:hypothetical protein
VLGSVSHRNGLRFFLATAPTTGRDIHAAAFLDYGRQWDFLAPGLW